MVRQLRVAAVVAALIPSMNSNALAIIWDFGREGDGEGWVAIEDITSGGLIATLSPLESAVEGGVWRVEVKAPVGKATRPAVRLISPKLGHDSALFDRVELRMRIVSSQAVEGSAWLMWRNTIWEKPEVPCGDCPQFLVPAHRVVFTTDWQEIRFADLRSGDVGPYEIVWEGELLEVRPRLWFDENAPVWPTAIEIDWIRLTGTGELLEGQLSPPEARQSELFGELFAEAKWSPVEVEGLGGAGGLRRFGVYSTSGALGNIDGDSLPDLVLPVRGGFVSLSGDGLGGFRQPVRTAVEDGTVAEDEGSDAPYVNGADLNRDGLMDVVVSLWEGRGQSRVLLRETNGAGWLPGQEFASKSLGLADSDGDGAADLWRAERQEGVFRPFVHLGDGEGQFGESMYLEVPRDSEIQYDLVKWVHGGSGQRRGALQWAVGSEEFRAIFLEADGGVGVESLRLTELGIDGSDLVQLLQYAGDLDADGDVDLILSEREREKLTDPWAEHYESVMFLWNRGDGSFAREGWLPEVHLDPEIQAEPVVVVDVNNDGHLDYAFIDFNEREHPAMIVGVGQEEGRPVLEGRYGFEGLGGVLLAGDVDLDGDLDLVMNRSDSGNEGIYTWLNQLDPATSVTDGSELRGATPEGPALGANYPNPFNSQTWIPMDVPEGGVPLELRVFNMLGQPVRTPMSGPAQAGRHVVPWDGKDEEGRGVPAGVYLYRLRTGDDVVTKKMVKVE